MDFAEDYIRHMSFYLTPKKQIVKKIIKKIKYWKMLEMLKKKERTYLLYASFAEEVTSVYVCTGYKIMFIPNQTHATHICLI